ncbi:dTDP-4-amino-4,6-dideoxygalactose transaminase [Hephaestia caeni]|uniref:dTDP-4-amino-4,6-dideoxygalactose transaminase n=1 Tax=Hephaestia caeni TaxID=645617 RepID=A0A397NSJ6_9SPHN|nr:DegT/DnrJ/EryC1/StrS family aminotransferase [Hephaestia caeni]RIA37695.1 dTDP-4-amino-4,6-dideoxygalactose transaminase [Hephaestia caeni]
MTHYPLIAPRPPKLSEHLDALRRVEQSGIYSNNGPEVRGFEADVTERLFGGAGASLAVANATLGLMIAIREAATPRFAPGALALMPALTFAATAQAAEWAGLTPLIADIDPETWSIDPDIEERLLALHGRRIAVVVPYATFGNAIDLDRYAWLQRRYEVGVVIDAASSLGTIDAAGKGFGADAPFATVFSMHATKTFAVAEGGLVHSGDTGLIDRLRAMINFGFQGQRSATLPGLNAKLPEVLAVMARAKLEEIEAVCAGRAAVEAAYRDALGDRFMLQTPLGTRRAIQFMPVLLPEALAGKRAAIVDTLAAEGVGCGQYFSPHLGEQPWFRDTALIEPTPVSDAVAGRMLSLPVTDAMTADDARRIAATLARACDAQAGTAPTAAYPTAPAIASLLVIGGGPAGTALLDAATKRGLLPDLAASGLVMVERDTMLGGGRLGRYGINSDSTAETFLSAIKDNVHPELADLIDHPAARDVARYSGALGVPLTVAGPLIRAMGERLGSLVERHGGTLLTGHEAIEARQTGDGLWNVRLRRLADGAEIEQRARHIAIATGGHQPLDRLAQQQVAGAPLVASAGDRLIQSDEVLGVDGYARIADLLGGKRDPRVVVIGGSTSAIATIALLLKSSPAIPWGPQAITLLHRRALRPFYPTPEAAHEEGFTDFGPDDICPVSGFVYRLAGFRLEARELVLRMMRVDGRTPEPRVRFHRIAGDDAEARGHLAEADLVIAAMGYRPRVLPLSDANGDPIDLAAHHDAAMVDKHCRIVGADGQPIANAFGIGLAAGFVPWGPMGGEKSFVGQANGLWQWQNDVGLMIVDQVLGQSARAVA